MEKKKTLTKEHEKGKLKGHMELSDRIQIEKALNERKNFSEIALIIGKNKTTISREVKAHFVEIKVGNGGGKFNDCAKRPECKLTKICGKECSTGRTQCKSCARMCNKDGCPLYEQYICPKLSKPPFVCNGCDQHIHHHCTLTRNFYRASEAQKEYERILVEARSGVAISEEDANKHAELIRPLLEHKQSVYNILLACPEIEYTEKTVYNYIEQGVYPGIGNYALPRKIRYRARKKVKPIPIKVDKHCTIDRSWEDYQNFIKENPTIPVIEMDCVEGLMAELKTLLTLHFRDIKFQMIFILEQKTSAEVIRVFKELRNLLGLDFAKIFVIILTDNGTEFSNPIEIEAADDGEITTRIFYCQPYSFTQKGACEKNHEEIRYILPKKSSIQFMTQEKAAIIMSHINSLARASLGGRTPYEKFVDRYGEEPLKKLGVQFISPKDVNLTPSLIK